MADKPKTVKVKLSKAATIAGEDVKEGGEATVTEAQAIIMREHGFIDGDKPNE